MVGGFVGFALGLILGAVFVYLQTQKLQAQEQQLKKVKQESNKKIRDVERENELIKGEVTTFRLEKEQLEQRLNNLNEDQQYQVQQLEQSYRQQIQDLEQANQRYQHQIATLEESYEQRIQELQQQPRQGDFYPQAQLEQSYQDQVEQMTASYEKRIQDLENSYNNLELLYTESYARNIELESTITSTTQEYEERIRLLTTLSTQAQPQLLEETPTSVSPSLPVLDTQQTIEADKETVVYPVETQEPFVSTETEIYTQEEIQQALEADLETMVYPFPDQEATVSRDTEILSAEEIKEMLRAEELKEQSPELESFPELISVEELESFSSEALPTTTEEDSFSEVFIVDEFNPFTVSDVPTESQQFDDLFSDEEEPPTSKVEKVQSDDLDLLNLIGDDEDETLDDELADFMAFEDDQGTKEYSYNVKSDDDLDLMELLGEDDSDQDLAAMFELDESEKSAKDDDLELFSDLSDEEKL